MEKISQSKENLNLALTLNEGSQKEETQKVQTIQRIHEPLKSHESQRYLNFQLILEAAFKDCHFSKKAYLLFEDQEKQVQLYETQL